MDVLENFLFPKAVNGLLSECIRRYFFPSRAKETKKQKKKKKIIIIIIITPDLRLRWDQPGHQAPFENSHCSGEYSGPFRGSFSNIRLDVDQNSCLFRDGCHLEPKWPPPDPVLPHFCPPVIIQWHISYQMSSIDAKWPETPSSLSKWHTLKDWQISLETSSPFFWKPT